MNIVESLFSLARFEGVPFLLIRPKDISGPEIYSGDFDLLIKPESLDCFLLCVMEVCSKNSFNFCIRRRKKEKINLNIYLGSGEEFIDFDLWTELDVKDSGFPRGTFISWSDLESSGLIINDSGRFFLDNNFSAMYYMSHLYSKRKNINDHSVKRRIDYYRNLDGLSSFSHSLLWNVNNKSMQKANREMSSLGLFSHSRMYRLKKLFYRSIKKLEARSNMVAVIGPDGVGKTTIINRFCMCRDAESFRFKRLFRRRVLYKVVFSFNLKKEEKKYGQPLEKNQFDDLNNLTLFWISLIPGYLLSFFSRVGKMKVLDRYYIDLLMSGVRFEDKDVKVNNSSGTLINIAPSTKCIIQLDAPSDIIIKRKKELSHFTIDVLRREYFKLVLKKKPPLYYYINTNNSIESTFEFVDNLGF